MRHVNIFIDCLIYYDKSFGIFLDNSNVTLLFLEE